MPSADGAKRINCVCGKVVEGRGRRRALGEGAGASAPSTIPISSPHVSRDDILAQAEEI